jgi:pimeloyl-ACP methyl ester carboxylesterase
VVALDLPGHGQSDRWHPPSEVNVALYRDAVGTVCKTLGIERAILVGHSLGSLVAVAAAAAWPERVAGVVLVGGARQVAVPREVFQRIERDFVHFPTWFTELAWSSATPREVVDRWAAVALTADQEITLADFRAAADFDAGAVASSLRLPALVLGGADDLLTPAAETHALAKQIPYSRARVLLRTGHFPMLEDPDSFYHELDRFLVGLS